MREVPPSGRTIRFTHLVGRRSYPKELQLKGDSLAEARSDGLTGHPHLRFKGSREDTFLVRFPTPVCTRSQKRGSLSLWERDRLEIPPQAGVGARPRKIAGKCLFKGREKRSSPLLCPLPQGERKKLPPLPLRGGSPTSFCTPVLPWVGRASCPPKVAGPVVP